MGEAVNAQGRFMRAEVGGVGQRVRSAVEVMQKLAQEIRGEVRGSSAGLGKQGEKLAEVAARCEGAAWGFRKAVAQELGDWGREREEVWRGRDREIRSKMEKALKILRRLEGAARGSRDGDRSADSGSDTACSAAATVLGAVEAGERPGKKDAGKFVFGDVRGQHGGVQHFVAPPMPFIFGS